MIQCKECELFEIGPEGQKIFKCDPFTNIKEPECLQKWQLIRLDMIAASYQNMLKWYDKMGPMQQRIFKYFKREMDDIDEADNWKLDDEPRDDDNPDEGGLYI